ncbi:hypothetical protein A2153_02520 [Candidatus Gottesmanbacteria bacterium RBG_16_38_7b]|uniref:MIP18 family-like domain-containing protein n=1 Tax=Candidatus Gottesmanbacteria bacterium RBG_16_38_7b TaxID=1798372 RepID=A0A1F5YKJ4_9BACT|nr:MAG: hypothetical protein A2153_02520 [Candidatus Gottesmanbacteria bacterium RBG_16_38_7b]
MTNNKLNKKIIMSKLHEVPDPELGISIVDLGLIYNIKVDKKGKVDVLMTLTTMGCPLFDLIREPIEHILTDIPGVKEVHVNLTFEPPWSVVKMSKEAKIKLGFY